MVEGCKSPFLIGFIHFCAFKSRGNTLFLNLGKIRKTSGGESCPF